MDLILVLWSLFLYFGSYSCISDLILVLQILYLSYGSYTCVTELILVFQILYLYYETYSCTLDLIRSLFWYKSTRRYYTNSLYGGIRRYCWTYTCITELIFILRRLHLFGGTRRYYRDITERILVLRNLSLYGSTRKYYLFKCPKRHILVLISNLYIYLKVPVGTTNLYLYSYGGTHR